MLRRASLADMSILYVVASKKLVCTPLGIFHFFLRISWDKPEHQRAMRGPRSGAYATRASRQHDLEVRMTRVGSNDVGLVVRMVTVTCQEVMFHHYSPQL